MILNVLFYVFIFMVGQWYNTTMGQINYDQQQKIFNDSEWWFSMNGLLITTTHAFQVIVTFL